MSAAKDIQARIQASKRPVTLTVAETDALLSLLNRTVPAVASGETWRAPVEQHADELDEVITELGARQFDTTSYGSVPDDPLLRLRFERSLAALRLTWPLEGDQ